VIATNIHKDSVVDEIHQKDMSGEEDKKQRKCPPPISDKRLSKLREKRASSGSPSTLKVDGIEKVLTPKLLRPSDLLTNRAKAPGRKGSKRLNALGKQIFTDALSKEVLEARKHAKIAARKKLKKQALKRHHIGMELIATEERYVKSLFNLVTNFVVPLRTKIGKEDEVLTRAEFTKIFANVDQLLPLNQKLLESLKEVRTLSLHTYTHTHIHTYVRTHTHKRSVQTEILQRYF